ncbi:MAG: alpha-(1-_6)-mannopyranosyltransferase A [Mycobacteriaceae bacterium]
MTSTLTPSASWWSRLRTSVAAAAHDARRPLVLGVGGTVLMALASVGAGAIPRTDPLLEAMHLSWVRFGHGQQLATITVYLGVVLTLWAWTSLGLLVRSGVVGARVVSVVAGVWAVPLLVSAPLYSRDVYSYLAQGALLRDGFDPYAVGPVADPGPLLDNVSIQWTTTPAPYGPLFLLLARAVTRVTGEDVLTGAWLLRLAFLPGLALLAWAVPRLAAELGGRPGLASWLVLANPLVLVHLVAGAHNDLLMLGLMAAGVAMAVQGHHAAGVLTITLGVAVKATAGLALPFVVWIWFRHRRDRPDAAGRPRAAPTQFLVALAGSVSLFVALFGGLTLLCGTGLGWIRALSGSNKIINWLSVPTALSQLIGPATSWATGVRSDELLTVLRPVCEVVLVAAVVVVWWRSRHNVLGAVRGLMLSLVLVVLLSPAALPWYYTWALAFGAPLVRRVPTAAAAAAATTWLLLVFRPPGNPGLYNVGDLALATAAGYLVWRRTTSGHG